MPWIGTMFWYYRWLFIQCSKKMLHSDSSWANHSCVSLELPVTAKNKRSILGDIFKSIRFNLMTGEEIVNGNGPGKVTFFLLFIYYLIRLNSHSQLILLWSRWSCPCKSYAFCWGTSQFFVALLGCVSQTKYVSGIGRYAGTKRNPPAAETAVRGTIGTESIQFCGSCYTNAIISNHSFVNDPDLRSIAAIYWILED